MQMTTASRKRMENPDVWLHICSHLDNDTLERLARTSLWLIIRELDSRPHFWYGRVCHFTSCQFHWIPSQLWKEAYRTLISGHPKPATTELLIQASIGCDYDWTPTLDVAIKLGEPEVVKLLLTERKAEPRLVDTMALFQGVGDEARMEALYLFLTDDRVRRINPIFSVLATVMDELVDDDGKLDPTKARALDYDEVLVKADRDIRASVAGMLERHADPILVFEEMRVAAMTLAAAAEPSAASSDSSDESETF